MLVSSSQLDQQTLLQSALHRLVLDDSPPSLLKKLLIVIVQLFDNALNKQNVSPLHPLSPHIAEILTHFLKLLDIVDVADRFGRIVALLLVGFVLLLQRREKRRRLPMGVVVEGEEFALELSCRFLSGH